MCFRAIIPQNKDLKNCWKNINYFPREGGGGGGPPPKENSMKIINIFVEPFPNLLVIILPISEIITLFDLIFLKTIWKRSFFFSQYSKKVDILEQSANIFM